MTKMPQQKITEASQRKKNNRNFTQNYWQRRCWGIGKSVLTCANFMRDFNAEMKLQKSELNEHWHASKIWSTILQVTLMFQVFGKALFLEKNP